ncbi:hypothetical protein C8R46DRAFT_1125272 [Mycena filopes]|nr:hypothetical protein C8R46DRAFT_1125272 [Mycena filopes]
MPCTPRGTRTTRPSPPPSTPFGISSLGRPSTARSGLRTTMWRAGRLKSRATSTEFFDAPVALIFTISSELRQGSWMDLGHFMQSVTIGVRAHGLESVTHNELVACSMSVGYPDLEKVAKNYARPAKRALGDVLEIYGM